MIKRLHVYLAIIQSGIYGRPFVYRGNRGRVLYETLLITTRMYRAKEPAVSRWVEDQEESSIWLSLNPTLDEYSPVPTVRVFFFNLQSNQLKWAFDIFGRLWGECTRYFSGANKKKSFTIFSKEEPRRIKKGLLSLRIESWLQRIYVPNTNTRANQPHNERRKGENKHER